MQKIIQPFLVLYLQKVIGIVQFKAIDHFTRVISGKKCLFSTQAYIGGAI